MEARELLATRRMGTGKGTARKLRATGLVPGVCYGRGSEPIALALDPVALKAALEGAQGLNTLLRLEIDDGGSKDRRLVMLKDRQYQLADVVWKNEVAPLQKCQGAAPPVEGQAGPRTGSHQHVLMPAEVLYKVHDVVAHQF